jgi:hypothetical protein
MSQGEQPPGGGHLGDAASRTEAPRSLHPRRLARCPKMPARARRRRAVSKSARMSTGTLRSCCIGTVHGSAEAAIDGGDRVRGVRRPEHAL